LIPKIYLELKFGLTNFSKPNSYVWIKNEHFLHSNFF